MKKRKPKPAPAIPPPTPDELARMRLPEQPLSGEERWVCWRRDYGSARDGRCSVLARTAFSARQQAAVILGAAPESVDVGVVS